MLGKNLLQEVRTSSGSPAGGVFIVSAKLKDIEKSVDNKIDEIYKNVEDTYTVSYEVYSKTLVKFDDGRYAMRYLLNVELTPIDSNNTWIWSEGPMFFVYL